MQRVAKLVGSKLPTYVLTPSSEVWIGMLRILERVVEGDPFSPPTESDRDAAYGTGIQGGRAGISAEDLVAAVLLGAREVEAEILERARVAGIGEGIRHEAASRSRSWAEQVAVWAAEGLGRTDRGLAAERRELAQRLVATLRSGGPLDRVLELVADVGLDVAAPLWVVVVHSPVEPSTVQPSVESAAFRVAHRGRAIWTVDGDATIGFLAGRPRPMDRLIVGMSGPNPIDDLGAGLRDAGRAARVATALAGPVFTLWTHSGSWYLYTRIRRLLSG